MVVMIPLVGESNPSRCLFFSKNSATLMVLWCLASSSARVIATHLGNSLREGKFLLDPGTKIFKGHEPLLLFALADDQGEVSRP